MVGDVFADCAMETASAGLHFDVTVKWNAATKDRCIPSDLIYCRCIMHIYAYHHCLLGAYFLTDAKKYNITKTKLD